MPPFSWPPMIFCKGNANCWFFCVSRFQKNGQICGFHWTSNNQKCFSFRGLCPPDPLPKGSALGPRWGLCLQTLVIGPCYCARHGAMPFLQILQARTATVYYLFCRPAAAMQQVLLKRRSKISHSHHALLVLISSHFLQHRICRMLSSSRPDTSSLNVLLLVYCIQFMSVYT